MIPEIGQRFGPYEILSRLGGGGMGLVFRAWDERLQREVAIKLLHDDYAMPGMRERFLQEARAASRLNHPNICTVFDIGEQDRNPYLVMELLEGETLKERIERGALPADEIVRYAVEIADALTAAHSKGIVHRDIKPANIFLVAKPNGRSQAKVLDFGLAKIELEVRGRRDSQVLKLGLTQAGSTVGTLSYMSPEQARGELLDARSDLFSLGIVLYEMATRQVPFKGTTSALMFLQLFQHTPEPIRNWNESVPRALEKAIFKLLEKSPKKRFQTARELQEALGKTGGKLERVSWTKKGSSPVVPLVRASDPVAWHRGDRRSQVMNAAAAPGGMIRPMRPRGVERGSVGMTAMHFLRSTVVAVESAAMPAQVRASRSANAARNSIRKPAGYPQPALSRLGTSLAQFECVIDETASGVGARKDSSIQFLVEESTKISARTQFRMVAVAALILTGVVVMALGCSGVFRPLVLGANDHLLLTVVQNRTGDKALDGTVMQGLEIALGQSRSLNVLGGEAYRAGVRQVEVESGVSAEGVPEQRVAQSVGARAYLYGEIKGTAPYVISVDVLKSDSNDKVETLEERAASRAEIPVAIGRLALDIRSAMTEDTRTEARNSVPLEREGTANIDALHAYAVGEAARQGGRVGDALKAYGDAVKLDPKFVQAQMQLAWLYTKEKAEVASASAAAAAQSAAGKNSERVKQLVEFCYEMNSDGDYDRALEMIRGYVARNPADVDGRNGLARALRAEGNLPEALQAAQQSYSDNPFDAEAYSEAELAMIGMDRYEAALQVEGQAERVGVARGGSALLAGYLAGKDDVVAEQGNAMQVAMSDLPVADGRTTYAELYRYGLYLDNIGRTDAGLEVWKTASARASNVPELASTQASTLAQGALDRALMERCTVALELVEEMKELPKGPVAIFNGGMAAALCGDQAYAESSIAMLQKSFPKNSAVGQYLVPELQAASAIGVNEPEKALDALASLQQFDDMSLGPYLRGMANAALGQMPPAIRDFQMVLAHRGVDVMLGSNAYPMAEMNLARALAVNRDRAGSADAYRRFLAVWRDADQGQPLITEATAKTNETLRARR
jgi:tRNA A-37 threonylcarbamoyl transferase component Bud32